MLYENVMPLCSKCGSRMEVEEYFEEREYDRKGIPTGRVRTAASCLVCPNCFHKEVIDDTFDGPWHY